jgi:hypothetical protein
MVSEIDEVAGAFYEVSRDWLILRVTKQPSRFEYN